MAYGIGRHRTLQQASAFGIRQIVDMALRALSPGINDTTTAVMWVDDLTAILTQRATRDIPSPQRHEDGGLRVIALGPTFASLAAEAFDQIRDGGSGNVAILLRMLAAVEIIASLIDNPGRRQVLRELAESGERTLKSPRDRVRFESRLAQVRAALASAPSPKPNQPAKASS